MALALGLPDHARAAGRLTSEVSCQNLFKVPRNVNQRRDNGTVVSEQPHLREVLVRARHVHAVDVLLLGRSRVVHTEESLLLLCH